MEGFRWRSLVIFLGALLLLTLPLFAAAFISIDSIVNTQTKKIAFILFGLSFLLLPLAVLKPKFFLFALIPVAIIAPIELYLIFTLKSALNEGIMASFFTTNFNEAIGVISANVVYVIPFLALILGYIYLSFKIPAEFCFKKKARIGFVLFFIMIQGIIIARDVMVARSISPLNPPKLLNAYAYRVKAQKTFPINWVMHCNSYFVKSKQLKSYNERVRTFKFGAYEVDSVDNKKVMVLVIGETARRHNFSLYGYHRKTNPLLEQEENIIAMQNAESVYNLTSFAYPTFLSRATDENFDLHLSETSIMKAFQEAGFYTVYINNQPLGHGSIYDTYASQSDTLIDLSTSLDFQSTDAVILPVFEHWIRNPKHEKTLVVIHSLGSHFRYNYRYPQEYEIYKPAISSQLDLSAISRKMKTELVNSYDNTILFTDYFLSGLITTLKANPDFVSLMMYASDHGENLYDDEKFGFAHGGSVMSRYEKEIPLLIWRSNGYDLAFGNKVQTVKNNINTPINTNHFFHSMLDLAGVYIDDETLENSFASERFVVKPTK